MGKVTRVLTAIEAGDPHAAEELLPLVYDELRRLAKRRLAREAPGRTLQTTALVHEVYLRLVGRFGQPKPHWDSQGHFFAAAAEAMRRILIDRARQRRAQKRAGNRNRLSLSRISLRIDDVPDDILDLDEALTKLAAEDPVKAHLVKLRFYAGLSLRQAARLLDISLATADRYWAYARAWLYVELGGVRDD